MKILERVSERRLSAMFDLVEIQWDFMPDKETVVTLFLVRMWQEKYETYKM